MIWKSNIFEKVSFLTDLPNIVLGVHWKRCWGSGVGGRGGEMVMYWTYKIHYYLVWKVICYCVRSIEDNFLCRYFFCFVYFFFFLHFLFRIIFIRICYLMLSKPSFKDVSELSYPRWRKLRTGHLLKMTSQGAMGTILEKNPNRWRRGLRTDIPGELMKEYVEISGVN